MRPSLVSAAVVLMAIGLSPLAAQDSGDASTRKVLQHPAPAYPELARKLNLKGTVKIEVVVAAAGNVKSTKVLGGNPVLASAATEAVRKWKYEPAAQDQNLIVELHFESP